MFQTFLEGFRQAGKGKLHPDEGLVSFHEEDVPVCFKIRQVGLDRWLILSLSFALFAGDAIRGINIVEREVWFGSRLEGVDGAFEEELLVQREFVWVVSAVSPFRYEGMGSPHVLSF